MKYFCYHNLYMLEKFLIYTKTVDFITWLFPTVNKFPKSQRFVLGQQVETAVLKFLEGVIRANLEKDKVERQKFLIQLDVELQILRSLLRVAYVLKFLSHRQFEFCLEQATELGKMLGGWVKQTASAVA